jgi:hypothetical protein
MTTPTILLKTARPILGEQFPPRDIGSHSPVDRAYAAIRSGIDSAWRFTAFDTVHRIQQELSQQDPLKPLLQYRLFACDRGGGPLVMAAIGTENFQRSIDDRRVDDLLDARVAFD